MSEADAYFYADIAKNIAAIGGGLAILWFIGCFIMNTIKGNDDWEL